jgi:methylamine---glutamate N-methyltransferase subunit A
VCGIVGLFLKDRSLEPELGSMLSRMLEAMNERGPDSAGLAVYGQEKPGIIKLTLRGPTGGADFPALAADLGAQIDEVVPVRTIETQAVMEVPVAQWPRARAVLTQRAPEITIVGEGTRMEVFKEVGLPSDVGARFGLEHMAGSHAIGHTRMATESAVTTDGAHPYSTGIDQCLVHNGSLSNHNAMRRELRREGMKFATENDTEVAAAYLTHRMRRGDSLASALERSLQDLDGFYTIVVGTKDGFGVLRDPIACKPAVMAETERYVAFGSEYRTLVDLPNIGVAHVWEPLPSKVYFWSHAS